MRKLSLLVLSAAFSGVVFAETAPPAPPVAPVTPPAVAPATPAVEEGTEGKEGKEGKERGLVGLHKNLDADKDGVLTIAEIDAAKSDKIKAKLKALDTSADGKVDAAEIEAGKKGWDKKKEHGEKEPAAAPEAPKK